MHKAAQSMMVLALLGIVAGCTSAPPPKTQSSPDSFSITAPINKAKQTATDVRQKALEREQLDPTAPPTPSPTDSP